MNQNDEQEIEDLCELAGHKKITKLIKPQEQIKFSCLLYKYNRRGKRQSRTLMVTNDAIYNLKKHDLKRKIQLSNITAVTISKVGTEFVLHVPMEYDYRFSSLQFREKIINIIKYYNKTPLQIFYKNDMTLEKFTTQKSDKKKKISKIPLKSDGDELIIQNGHSSFISNINEKLKVSVEDFTLLKVLGKGTFGKVMLVQKQDTKELYAMKSIRKQDIQEQENLEHTKSERLILETTNSPFLVKLAYAFQTNDKLYFIMQFMKGGELFQHLRQQKQFSEKRAKFYAAELILALNHLHEKNVIYRDLKPENILLDEKGHIALTDFGMAKILSEHDQKTNSFVGTAEYLAPEIITGEGHSFPVDIWSLGTFIFEMMYGVPPFYSSNHNTMFQLIKFKELRFPSQPQTSELAKDLISQMLIKDQNDRIKFNQIINHQWFEEIDWKLLQNKQIDPPFIPQCDNQDWLQYFDEEFTKEVPIHSVVNSNIPAEENKEDFVGITYIDNNIKSYKDSNGNNTISNKK